MSPQEFIENLVLELELRAELYSPKSMIETEVVSRLKNLGLSEAQESELYNILKLVLAETTYGILCGLEGTGSIGKYQGQYKLISESGQELTGALDSLFFEKTLS